MQRLHTVVAELDPRDARGDTAQVDRDRVLYSSALRRLDGITQVVSPRDGQPFHNRLTHSLKVAQLGRRMAERLVREHATDGLLDAVGGLDPDVVETAALAHDIGHPPFGHVTDKELCSLLEDEGLADGYEGNAQSFRVVTKLAAHRFHYAGLDLTRASLNALLKYPWLRDTRDESDRDERKHSKWGAYSSERDVLEWVRGDLSNTAKCAEAALMDWADDVAYSVHDAEDFCRAGLVPLDRLRRSADERQFFMGRSLQRLRRHHLADDFSDDDLTDAFGRVVGVFPLLGPYTGTFRHRAMLRAYTSQLIQDHVNSVELTDPQASDGKCVRIGSDSLKEVTMLKELIWCYVIHSPALATQQHGQKEIIRTLFMCYLGAAKDDRMHHMFPEGTREELTRTEPSQRARVVADMIASMSEAGAIALYQRLTGRSPGSVLDGQPQ